MSNQEKKLSFKKINNSGANIIWISLGGVKQVVMALEMKETVVHSYIILVGAAFDFISGKKPQAPVFFQKNGLEWLFRLFSEPRRLWKRYFLQIPIFLVILGFELIKKIFLKIFNLLRLK
jgi:exopolysaccharide biosynthesis WecB/TagA/CpsF family protein